jgi:hypothetical protein
VGISEAITTITTAASGMLSILTSSPCIYFVAIGLCGGAAALIKKLMSH